MKGGKMMNKKGASMIEWVGIVILVVVGVVIVALAFSGKFNDLWNKGNALSGGSSTLTAVSDSCAIACGKGGPDAGSANDAYCKETRNVEGITTIQVNKINSQASALATATGVSASGAEVEVKPSTTTNAIGDKVTVKSSGVIFTISGITCDQLAKSTLISTCNKGIIC